MTKLLKLLAAGVGYFCVATVLAQGVGGAYLVFRVGLDQDKAYRLFAVLENVDLEALRARHEAGSAPAHSEQLSPDEVLKARLQRDLHYDLRETALDKGLLDLRVLESRLKTERERYDELKQSFDERLAELERGAADTSLQEVQRTLEAIAPKQAKEQILQMLADEDPAEAAQALSDVVTIFKAMPLDKRKKIIGEFKSIDEARRLHEILREIRLGEPEMSLIRDTREQAQGL